MSRIQLVLISSLFIGCTSGFEPTSELSEAPTKLSGKDPTQTVPGNPTCQSLGLGDSEFKLNSPPTGSSTHNLGSAGTITFQIDSGGIYLDWTATIGIDGVIVKGGTSANVYVYNPEALADSGLHSPVNNSGHYAAISHISICYDVEPDLCAGVVCAPADACQQEGVCEPTTGQCVYAPKPVGTTCRESAGACDVAEVCDGTSGACPADEFLPSTTECRGSAGACDPAELCTGDSAACPADDLADQGTTCRASAGVCDVAEVCTGDSAACPADDFAEQGTTCRGSAGACDVAEVCTGASAECPDDGKSTAVCRAAAGDCDVAEVCDGASNECPADGFSAGNTCRASAGICDVAEVCSGASPSCPADGFSAGNTCRASAGECDVAEVCSGSSAACPADGFSSGNTCRASAGDCDVAEVCSGSSASCPADGFSSGNTCRASAGECDVAEVCSGSSASCPADGFSSGNTCRASAGECDVAEVCSGSSASCPADGFSSGNTCREPAGDCDVAEVCSGSSVSCPSDGFATGTTCRAAAGDCDVAEQCTGASANCPTDGFVDAGTECRGSADACDPAEKCTGQAAACPADVSATCQVCGDKYYDANTNSAQDAGELSIAGWKVTITDANGNATSAYTNSGGSYLFSSLAAGVYTVCEEMPIGDAWFQTAPAEICYSVSLPLPSNECSYDFGNVCLGAGGGHTPGFWQNKNGKTMFMGNDGGASSLALVVSLNLRGATGAHFDPPSYQVFAQWLSATNAVNMAAQLSRHLAAMALNVKVGFVDGTDLVYAPGAQGANAMGFITIDALITEANIELGLHGDTWIPGPERIYQEALKNALDAANNNKNFVQSEACAFTFETLVEQVAHDQMHGDGLPRDGEQPDVEVDQGGCSTTGTGASLAPILLALGMLFARRRRRP